jgi:transposase-like protein
LKATSSPLPTPLHILSRFSKFASSGALVISGIDSAVMAAHSKFTAERRQIIVEHLAAGFSRRGAARAAGIDHETLSRWIKRGEKGAPGGRWAEFHRAVTLAEDKHDPPILVPLKPTRATRAEVEEAWAFLEAFEPGFARRPDPEPVPVVVAFSLRIAGPEGDSA